MDRHHWSRRISQLDPARDYEQIYRILATHEFPWDMNQSLSFALYRTYAVPSIGRLLAETGEFTRRTQKRYDDTALILDTILEHGLASTARMTSPTPTSSTCCVPSWSCRSAGSTNTAGGA
jgi:hypothetical protein